MDAPRMRIASVVLGAPNPRSLAAFYQRLLGWTVVDEASARLGLPPEDGWAMLRPAAGATGLRGLVIPWEPDYRAPVWPPASGDPQMMLHFDIAVEQLDEAVAWALQAGATLAEHQPKAASSPVGTTRHPDMSGRQPRDGEN